MNGPAIDSLEIRHTPATVPGGARPGWGLPYQQLPAATQTDLSPESFINKQIQTGRQQIQDKYALQWKEVNRSRRFVGVGKTKRMLREIDAKAKQEMLQFNQQAQTQMTQLQNINRFAEQGLIPNADELKARIVYGPDVARSMYPRPERERSTALQFGELDVYSRRIENVLDQFRRKKERIPSIWLGKKKEGVKPGKVQIWDINTPGKINKETNKVEYWRDASPEEIQMRNMYLGVQEGIKRDKEKLLGQPDISRRIVQPDTIGGTFGDKIAESYKKPVTRRQQPKVIRQRNTRTGQERISYDGGKTWKMVGR